MSLGKRLRDIGNVGSVQASGKIDGGYYTLGLFGAVGCTIRYINNAETFDLNLMLRWAEKTVAPSTLFILDASIIEGLDLQDTSETLTKRPTFKIHYAALHKNLLAIHALYYGRIYTYDEKADAFHTWHLERIERGWSLLTMSEEIKPDWIVLDECDCMSRHLPGRYKIARFTDACWWKGSAYEAKDQRRQDAHKATYYKQQQRETHKKQDRSDDAKSYSGARASGFRQGPEGYKWYEESFDEWFQGFKQRAYKQAYGAPPPPNGNEPGSILWAYSTLGLERGHCSLTDVRRARKTLMKQYHPDLAGDTPANLEKTQEINWAFDVLQGVLA